MKMPERFEGQEGADPILAYANCIPGTGDSEVGAFVRENLGKLLEDAVKIAGEGAEK